MLLTRSEQIDTLYAAAQNAGLDVAKGDISWQDEVIDVAGMKIHYLDWGSKGKRPLLLLHGGMQSAHTWDLIAVAMKRDFHVVAMDLRGHGASDWAATIAYVREAERLGVHSVWSAEAWGHDGITPLAFLAGQTSTIKLGSGILQAGTRTPALLGMTAMGMQSKATSTFSRRPRRIRKSPSVGARVASHSLM